MINKIKDFFRNIKHGLKNLYVWFPIIWNDRQWDFQSMLEILDKKLELMVNSNYCEDERYKYLKIAHKLSKKVKNDEYENEAMAAFEITSDSPYTNECGLTIKSFGYNLIPEKAEIFAEKYKPVFKKHNLKSSEVTTAAMILQNKARKLLFKILGEKLEWW